ncbi:NHL repeat containing protein [Candidatus Magnetoovum chiemensis]|nr:NHL repeat containing protein [Candidatus Magnetoovum chiemensis]
MPLNRTTGMAIDSTGYLYVATVQGVIKYSKMGVPVYVITSCGNDDLLWPHGLAVDSNDSLYVCDRVNSRVLVYDSSGNCIRTIDGMLSEPFDVSVDTEGNIYVADYSKETIEKLNSSGTWTNTFLNIERPWSVETNGGYIYAGSQEGYIVKYNSDGTMIKKWGSSGISSLELRFPTGMSIYNNYIYVSDVENARVQAFDTEGNFYKSFFLRGTGQNNLNFPYSIAISSDKIYIGDSDNDRILKTDINGNFIKQMGSGIIGNSLSYPTDVTVDDASSVMYIADSGNYRILKLSLDMKTLYTQWGSYGSEDGQFIFPYSVQLDSVGNVYVVDNAKRDIQKFTSDGTFLSKFSINFNTNNLLYGLHMFRIVDDEIYVLDAGTDKLYKTDLNGSLIATYSTYGFPTAIEIDKTNGYIYLLQYPKTVHKYDLNFNEINSFGSTSSYTHISDFALDDTGNLYVIYQQSHRMVKYDTNNGNVLYSIGNDDQWAPSVENGKFAYPYGLDIDNQGNIYVADTNNHRIQKFSKTPPSEQYAQVSAFFNDVSSTYWAEPYISYLIYSGVTSGCQSDDPATAAYDAYFCPDNQTNRAQMAIFILKSLEISPADTCTASVFSDVTSETVGDIFCRYIEKFSELNITSGCTADDPITEQNERQYCPLDNTTRAQMAMFILKALSITPASPCASTYFNDINGASVGNLFCQYIERFLELGITAGCGNNLYCPFNDVTRAEMAIFLSRAFLE